MEKCQILRTRQTDRSSCGREPSKATEPDRRSRTSSDCTPTDRQPVSVRPSTFARHFGEILYTRASTSSAHGCASRSPDARLHWSAVMKWIACPGCGDYKRVRSSARSCSNRCRNRIWRQTHGRSGNRLEFCAWCKAPLLYMPQDRLPGVRRFCDDSCARKAWLAARIQKQLTCVGALEVAIRRLQRSRYPRYLVAAERLLDLKRDLLTQEDGRVSNPEGGRVLTLRAGTHSSVVDEHPAMARVAS
jgi:hypothetical protein